jgi:hypothetical protein
VCYLGFIRNQTVDGGKKLRIREMLSVRYKSDFRQSAGVALLAGFA